MPGSWTRARAVLDSDKKVKSCKNSENIGVYKFTITEDIPYPKKKGRVIYIGKSESKSIYKRIEEHLKKRTNLGLCNYIELSKVNVSFRIASTANQCKIWEHDEILSHQNEYGAYPATNMKSGSKKKKGKRVYQNPKCRICKYRRPRRKDGTCPCRG